MNKKFISLIVTLLLAVNMLSAASMRDYVCIVRGQYADSRKTYLKSYAEKLSKSGYSQYGEYINEYLEGTFGSGFVYYASNGKPFIVTNKHVVNDYQSANVSFENDDGSVSEYKNLKIFAISQDFDLAILQLPDTFKKPGLQLKETGINDGIDVYSAGFPGLAGNPSWQLGKGVVSNSRARVKELINPSVSTIIQHTAEIDRGNSGGPLLVSDSKAASGFAVAGVNTWKVLDRQNTNFAIPATLVKKFVEESISNNVNKTIEAEQTDFLALISTEEASFNVIEKYISDDMVETYGDSAFKTTLAKASTEDRTEIVSAFKRGPFEGLRYALCHQVWNQFFFYEKFQKPLSIDYEDTSLGKKVIYHFDNNKEITSTWILVNNRWQIFRFSTILSTEENSAKTKAATKGKVYFEVDDPYMLGINGCFIAYPFSIGGNAEFNYLFNYGSVGFNLGSVKMNYAEFRYNLFQFTLTSRLQIPLRFNDFIIEPFVQGDAGVGVSKDEETYSDSIYYDSPSISGIFYGAEAGIEFMYCTPVELGICFGAKYFYQIFTSTTSKYTSQYGNPVNQGIAIYAGLKFLER